jgi:hypothetical protein
MIFSEALVELKQGKLVARRMWFHKKYLILLPDISNPWEIQKEPSIKAGNWEPIFFDFLADDWQIVEWAVN